jgi:hypothetical protein
VAARQYILELRRVGILDEDSKSTELANQWRMDDSYVEAVNRIAHQVYPEGLVTIAPPGGADRQKVVNWFMNQGLGEGSAKNKAATYLLITSNEPNTAPSSSTRSVGAKNGNKQDGESSISNAKPSTKPKKEVRERLKNSDPLPPTGVMPLNVNVQIHISADATSEQIETIFASMKKYLRND